MANRNKKKVTKFESDFTEEELKNKPWREKLSEEDKAKARESDYRHYQRMEEEDYRHEHKREEDIFDKSIGLPFKIAENIGAKLVMEKLVPKVVPKLAEIFMIIK